jgi:hypothetical protein
VVKGAKISYFQKKKDQVERSRQHVRDEMKFIPLGLARGLVRGPWKQGLPKVI